MIKDIEFNKVEDIGIAIIPDEADDGTALWNSFLINFKEVDIEGIMVRAKGVGKKGEETVETSTLRILLEKVGRLNYAPIDSFAREASGLSNEYWISFRIEEYLFDKKYVFVPESIVESNFIEIPFLGKKGVMIR